MLLTFRLQRYIEKPKRARTYIDVRKYLKVSHADYQFVVKINFMIV